MENNAMDTGSRVTRSLRKRLTSVDNDNSSRAGTPISTKLTSISEISSSPSRVTRITRRNSSSGILTPVKTPAKRGGVGTLTIAEDSETLTPARKSTRRRSVSENENEETSKTGSKIPTFPVLDEEDASNDEKTARVTRSQSKSPQKTNTMKPTIIAEKPKSPKEKTYKEIRAQNINKDIENEEDISDVEITVLENEIADNKNKSLNITTINLTEDESNQTTNAEMKETENHPDETKFSVEKNDFELLHAINAADKDTLKINESQVEKNIIDCSSFKNDREINLENHEEQADEYICQKENEESTTSCQTKGLVDVEKQKQEKVNLQEATNKDNELKCGEVISKEYKKMSPIVQDAELDMSTNETNNLNSEDCTTLKPNEKQFLSDKVEIINVSTVTDPVDCEVSNINVCQGSSKKVEFVSSPSNDMTIKNIYPKTPASTKTSNSFKGINSCRNDNSFLAEYNSFLRSDDLKNDFLESENNKNEINQQKVEPKMMEANITPDRGFEDSHLLEKKHSLSSYNVESPKRENLLLLKNSNQIKEKVAKTSLNEFEKSLDAEIIEADNYNNKEELKWIEPCIKGTTANGSKLDVVDQHYINANDCSENTDVVKQVQQNENTSCSSENIEQEDEDEIEEPYKRKHDFHDDEAIEVNSYESGDSMDSEERKEIEENEIPVDSRSLGSHTTEDDQDEYDVEEEGSENVDSFIVSDEEEQESSENEDENKIVEKDTGCKTNVKTYKRSLQLTENSSSSDEEVEEDPQANNNYGEIDGDSQEIEKNLNTREKLEKSEERLTSQQGIEKMEDENATETKPVTNIQSEKNTGESIPETNKTSENIILELSKLSDSALRLHCSAESESEDENNVKKMESSRCEILRSLNQSDRLNKSVRDLNREIDDYQIEHFENKDTSKSEKSFDEGHKNSISLDNKIKSDSNLVEEESMTSESDPEKENEHKFLCSPHRQKNDTQMNVSFGSNKHSKGKSEWQRSFTIDVTLKNGELDAAVTDVKLKEPVSASSSPTDDGEYEKVKNDGLKGLENIRHMSLPLGNPLIRTRRQSLALPTNPDMEICPSSHAGGIGKKTKRKSLGVFSDIDFNPSQSFIETIELQKNERNLLLAKRKRLSKSFCGSSDTHDNSIVDIDVRHLDKRSKLMANDSMAECHQDSIENINSSKLFIKSSSTPHEKINKNDSHNNNQRILRRCDEILEAANRAKLEAKTNNKSKGKISKKLSTKKSTFTSSDETNRDDMLRRTSKEIKRKDKTKSALSQAIKAADNLLSKKKCILKNNEKADARFLAPDVLEAIRESAPIKKKCKKETVGSQEVMKENCHTASTTAGNFIELPQSPQKKKKKLTYIQLPTGKVSVEPITPKKHLVKSFNGMEFRESPITPSAIGFKVQQIAPPEMNVPPISGLIERKRKRYCNESLKNCTPRKSQWTQSGIFVEEEISKRRQIARSVSSNLRVGPQKTKKRQLKKEEHNNVNNNFKENALMRTEIRRSNKREILLLKERIQVREQY